MSTYVQPKTHKIPVRSLPFLLLDPLQLHKSCNPDQNAWTQNPPKNGNTIKFQCSNLKLKTRETMYLVTAFMIYVPHISTKQKIA